MICVPGQMVHTLKKKKKKLCIKKKKEREVIPRPWLELSPPAYTQTDVYEMFQFFF